MRLQLEQLLPIRFFHPDEEWEAIHLACSVARGRIPGPAMNSFDRRVLGFPSQAVPKNDVVPEHAQTPVQLVCTILRLMKIPECGLLLWFDGERTGRELMAELGDPLHMRAAFHPLAGIDMAPFPEKVKERMARDWYRLLVWLGRNVVEDRPLAFTITLAHELRHVEQFLHSPQIHHAGRVLLGYLRRLPNEKRRELTYFSSIVEWDAEARAREVAATLHGESDVQSYYKENGIQEFATRQRVHTVPAVLGQLKTWLGENWAGLVEVARSHPEPDEFRELLSLVNWTELEFPDP